MIERYETILLMLVQDWQLVWYRLIALINYCNKVMWPIDAYIAPGIAIMDEKAPTIHLGCREDLNQFFYNGMYIIYYTS